ncbi:MAG: hypothetical protein Q9162_000112 [Coniocarpon cinnabarinum]
MGEPLTAYTEIHPSHRSFAPLVVDGEPNTIGEEEPYTIKCICGFDDDAFDGATVFCEQCNTWQHIACYYTPNITLAPEAEHSCIDCKPNQEVNPRAATIHQETLRLPHALGDDRKAKRTSTKNHRKSKTRDLNINAVYVNGFALHDGQSGSPSTGSPRDSAPPAKKPKTSHRPSASINNGLARATNGRHRSASVAFTIPDPPPKPSIENCPPNYLSPEFIRVHHENTDFNPATANLHLNISVTSLLSTWLDDPDAFLEATNGKKHSEVLMQLTQPMEELEAPIRQRSHVKNHVRFHGSNPRWPFLTVDQHLVEDDFVGELRGCIGRREDYQNDPVNQWNKLRHPDHFVFFHPHLPIYIDARQEGTILRYARRSCRPNLKMKTIITGAREYRFCFTAARDIPKDEEITIPWDTQYDTQLQAALSKLSTSTMSRDDFLYVCDFFGTNLAHFGGCACENLEPGAGRCLLARFDRRASKDFPNGLMLENRGKRKRGTKKSLAQVSTHGSTSRESSEEALVNPDGDVDMADGRSTSQSTKSSRDATPNTARLSSATNGGELSERDKKKLAQQEKLFERMEHDRQMPPAKKKKRSSGSNANTPIVQSHRQNGRSVFSPSNPATPVSVSKLPFAPPHLSPNTRSPAASNAGRTSHSWSQTNPVKPVYVDAATQTEPELPPSRAAGQRQKNVPRSTLLLRRSLFQHRQKREAQTTEQVPSATSPATPSPTDSQPMDTDSTGSRSPSSPPSNVVQSPKATSARVPSPPIDLDQQPQTQSQTPLQLQLQPQPQEQQQQEEREQEQEPEASNIDVGMSEVDASTNVFVSEEADNKVADEAPTAPAPSDNPMEPVKPPPPPWPAVLPKKEDSGEPSPLAAPVALMKSEVSNHEFAKPPTPDHLSASKGSEPATEPAPSAARVPLQPPSLAIPPQSNRSSEANSLTKPSPVKKKMSLSDYMSKRTKPNAAADKTPTPGIQGTPPGSSGLDEAKKTPGSEAQEEAKG